jgi:hypothetical protein
VPTDNTGQQVEVAEGAGGTKLAAQQVEVAEGVGGIQVSTQQLEVAEGVGTAGVGETRITGFANEVVMSAPGGDGMLVTGLAVEIIYGGPEPARAFSEVAAVEYSPPGAGRAFSEQATVEYDTEGRARGYSQQALVEYEPPGRAWGYSLLVQVEYTPREPPGRRTAPFQGDTIRDHLELQAQKIKNKPWLKE